jgi:hypothetical protein
MKAVVRWIWDSCASTSFTVVINAAVRLLGGVNFQHNWQSQQDGA